MTIEWSCFLHIPVQVEPEYAIKLRAIRNLTIPVKTFYNFNARICHIKYWKIWDSQQMVKWSTPRWYRPWLHSTSAHFAVAT